ncbi:MAG: Flp pilus assembly protein CpaB [Chloroflexota bacterium]|nr:Flp pilus assembly protein CpaB [Chloroflexota bacterium]
MKRNRLFLAAGVVLAMSSFVSVLAFSSPSSDSQLAAPETVSVVVAGRDIRLGTRVAAEMLDTVERPTTDAVDTYRSIDEVVGSVVRRPVSAGQALQSRDFQNDAGADIAAAVRPGLRAIAVPLDRVTAVAYLIEAGDYVDVMIALEDLDGLNPLVVANPRAYSPGEEGAGPADPFLLLDEYVNNTSVKVIVQNVQVLATELVTPDETSNSQQVTDEPSFVAVLAVTPQQAELVRFAQLDGHVSLMLRSPDDQAATDVVTGGVTLQRLVEEYGVLPPRPVLP